MKINSSEHPVCHIDSFLRKTNDTLKILKKNYCPETALLLAWPQYIVHPLILVPAATYLSSQNRWAT